jgi:hypothetical protein
MRKTILFTVLAVACFILSCEYEFGSQTTNRIDYSKADLSYDRSQFGNAPFPFWFNLKPVEIRTLENVSQAKSGNPDALLGLALLASGDVRDSLTFNKYVTRVQGFVAKIRPAIAAERDFWQKGHALFASMRSEFLKTDSANDLAGYDFYQSKLSTLLETGKYNCISSAILYIVLARYFDMPVKGVVLPSHAFVQMTAPDGKVIEIETTAKNGFDWVHDEDYYKSRASAWLSSRGLPKSTYEDYTKRRIMEPYRNVCFNMTNQHTDPKEMKFEDIYRLKEIMGYVLDDDAAAQKERFAVYGIEFRHFQKREDFKTAERMFGKIMPSVVAEKQRFPGDADVARNAAILEYNHATMLLMVHKHDEFVVESRAALDGLAKSGTADTSEMYKGLLVNVYNYIRFYTDNMSDFADAESLATAFVPYARNQEWFLGNIQSVYGMELRSVWDKKNWPEAVRIIKKQRAVDVQGKNGAIITKNLEAAYVNWSLSYSNEGNWPKAKDVLRECVQDSASTPACGQMLDDLEKEHRY